MNERISEPAMARVEVVTEREAGNTTAQASWIQGMGQIVESFDSDVVADFEPLGCQAGLVGMVEYRCYSDASHQRGRSGFGIVVLIRESIEDRWQVYHEGYGELGAVCSREAELLAMIQALTKIPDSQSGVSYTDLGEIVQLLLMRREWTRRYTKVMDCLLCELERTGLRLARLPARKHRPHEYTQCHRMSRKAIGLTRDAPSKGKRKLRPMPKLRKWGRLYLA